MVRLEDITDSISSYNPEADLDLIWKAYVYSAKVHRGQTRASGEPYLSHPMEVAYLLTQLKMDAVSIAVGLLHDTLEDTYSTEEELTDLFGEEITFLVDGLTKIAKIEFSSKEEQQAENYRKMILAMSKDIRVIIIKLADRLHNMRTLEYMAEHKQKRVALETLDIYAPIANRLGIGWVKKELEDVSFRYLHPEQYMRLRHSVATDYDKRMAYIEEVIEVVRKELEASRIDCSVEGRPKHYYSIYKKTKTKNIDFNQVYDLCGIRLVSKSVRDCYSALGIIHSIWKPIPGKIKDYIAMPKANMYQSLHTTVLGPRGKWVELQIRTEEMHRICEEGVAAHWKYKEKAGKEDGVNGETPDQRFVWLRGLLEWQSELQDPKEFLETMRIDLYPHDVYVFTPAGEVMEFPQGATPLDFAYSIHTDVGHQCTGAKINGKIVPLKYKLENGDIVEILTSASHRPNRDWLKVASTSRAKSKIRHYLKDKENEASISIGKESLERELKKYHLSPDEYLKPNLMSAAAKDAGFSSEEKMLSAVGYGKYSLSQLLSRLVPKEKLAEEKEKESSKLKGKKASRRSAKMRKKSGGVRVRGIDDILIRFAKCCFPVPGDKITGLISRGQGVTVHTMDCPNINDFTYDPERVVEVEWDDQETTTHKVNIDIMTVDQPGMLEKISGAIAANGVNICRVVTRAGGKKGVGVAIVVELENTQKLQAVLQSIKQVEGVRKVERVKKQTQEKPEKLTEKA